MENEATTPDRETQQEETPLTHAHEAGGNALTEHSLLREKQRQNRMNEKIKTAPDRRT
jgi:hypothetical protein